MGKKKRRHDSEHTFSVIVNGREPERFPIFDLWNQDVREKLEICCGTEGAVHWSRAKGRGTTTHRVARFSFGGGCTVAINGYEVAYRRFARRPWVLYLNPTPGEDFKSLHFKTLEALLDKIKDKK